MLSSKTTTTHSATHCRRRTMLVIVVAVFFQMTLMTSAGSLGMYKSCLYECLNCVNTWGKELFNGERCADNCAETGGRSIDTTCASFFTRSSRRVVSSARHKYLHSDDITGRSRNGGYTNNYLGYRSFRNRKVPVGGVPTRVVAFRSRSTVSWDCQRLCRTCETRFTSGMDAHSCLYTCVRTKKNVIAC